MKKMFDVGKTRMVGLPYGEKNYDDMLSRFHLIPERNGQTDRQTDIFGISISRVSMLTRDKNCMKIHPLWQAELTLIYISDIISIIRILDISDGILIPAIRLAVMSMFC